jgi:hypothetical protein
MVTLFLEGAKGLCVRAGDTKDVPVPDSSILRDVDPPRLLSLVFTNAGFWGFGNIPEELEIISITLDMVGRMPASACVHRRAT